VDRIRIEGGRPLAGRVRIAGAKNAALPALAAALLTDEPVVFANLPAVADVRTMLRLLRQLGAEVGDVRGLFEPGADAEPPQVAVRAGAIGSIEAAYDLVRTMRASVLVLGPLLARAGRARVSLPGGCAIGARPIDMHLEGLRRMGARVNLQHGYVDASCERLAGADYTFPGVTVTGTENLMAAAALARGVTTLRNCAREPEVTDLAGLLRAMGARLTGDGTDVITIEGVERLRGAEHRVIPDRIEAGTYLAAAAMTAAPDGAVTIAHCEPAHLGAPLDVLRAAGARVDVGRGELTVRGRSAASAAGQRKADAALRAIRVQTAPYPGFATDLQAQFMALCTQSTGASTIVETIFESRFLHALELGRMGADIRVEGNASIVTGPSPLMGTDVLASDLRASACLVLAGLVASGETTVHRVYHLDRGYERMEAKLRGLGAAIERIPGRVAQAAAPQGTGR